MIIDQIQKKSWGFFAGRFTVNTATLRLRLNSLSRSSTIQVLVKGTMPILKNAKKALRVSHRKAALRQPLKSKLKTVRDTVKKTPTAESLSSAFSAIDRAVKRNIFHKKKAARMKSQLSKLVK